jgi:hypothetical protein
MHKRVWKVRVDGELVSITRSDVKHYFNHGHGMSGMRSLGPVSGDWQMIDAIAQDGKAYFGL